MELRGGLIIGTRTPEWGHTWIAADSGRYYCLRSLADGSSLVVYGPDGSFAGEWQTPGKHSCHVRIYDGKAVVCDYTSGSMGVWELDGGGLPAGDVRMMYFEKGSHIHSSWESPSDGALVVADLGADCLYRFGRGVTDFETFRMPEGSGPRHCAFGAGRLYVSTELSDEVLVLEYPSMRLIQRCLVNPEHPGGGAHVVLSRDGRFLYASSRLKNDGIAVFSVGTDGLLDYRGYCRTGLHPRHFSLRPDGLEMAVACRDSDSIEFYDIDPEDGIPRPGRTSINLTNPVFAEYHEQE